MKMYCPFSRLAAAFLFVMLFSANSVMAQPTTGPDDPGGGSYDTVRIEKTNWLNTLGCMYDDPNLPCIEIASDNSIIFRVRIRMSKNDITPYRPMRVAYFIYSYAPGGTTTDILLTEVIDNAMIEPIVLENGVPAYEASIGITVNLNPDCGIQKYFKIKIGYQLMESADTSFPAVEGPYPVADYPDLFPPGVFEIPATGYAEGRERTKDVCCFDPANPPQCVGGGLGGGGQFQNGGSSDRNWVNGTSVESQLQSSEMVKVSPNPFNHTINAQYVMTEAGNIKVSCLDAQGRLIASYQKQHAAAGTYDMSLTSSDWSPGVYFLHVETANAKQTLKVVKLAE